MAENKESPPKQLLNDPHHAVTEMIDGMILSSNAAPLAVLDGYPGIKVVVRDDWDSKTTEKVAVISGGGSGHEPFAGGYVGRGGLTAAVAGEVFASPSANAVYNAILAVGGKPGVLIVILNYTGDRLHFGLAIEKARAIGIQCATVVVDDDIAIPDKDLGIAGKRGIAGVALVTKIAGAAAEAGKSLEEVRAIAQLASDRVSTMGVALSGCTLPGKQPALRFGPREIELGLGIHGEPGFLKDNIKPVTQLVESVAGKIMGSYGEGESFKRCVLLINNLGGSTAIELNITAKAAKAVFEKKYGLEVVHLLVGTYVSSLNMEGFSISVLPLNQKNCEFQVLLESSSNMLGWRDINSKVNSQVNRRPLTSNLQTVGEKYSKYDNSTNNNYGKQWELVIKAACKALIDNEVLLTTYDRKVGDGDCGHTLKQGAEAVLKDLPKFPLGEKGMSLCFEALSCSVEHSMGGSSGALYTIYFQSVATYITTNSNNEKYSTTSTLVASALEYAALQLSQYGGAKVGDRTMLDTLIPSLRLLVKLLVEDKKDLKSTLKQVVDESKKLAENTKNLSANAGRSSYVPAEVLANTPDPGAVACALIIEAVSKCLSS